MSLLLAFRLRSCYDRWWQARCGFTGVGGACELFQLLCQFALRCCCKLGLAQGGRRLYRRGRRM